MADIFVAVLLLVAAERVLEVVIAARNARRSLARGGVESARREHWLVVILHFPWLAAGPLEVLLFDRPFLPPLAAFCVAVVVAAMVLRYWAVATLGDRWNLRVITVPGEAAVTTGPYRYLRHPNYLAVFVELFAVPMIHTAWLTALVLGGASALATLAKIRAEERVLAAHSDYDRLLGDRRRFLPGR
jgi:methyltransferase